MNNHKENCELNNFGYSRPFFKCTCEAEPQEECEHEWIDARNPVVKNGYHCGKCGLLSLDGKTPMKSPVSQSSWQERFKQNYISYNHNKMVYEISQPTSGVIDFIASVEKEAYQEGVEDGQLKVIEQIEKSLIVHSKENTYEDEESLVFKTTMQEVLSILAALKNKEEPENHNEGFRMSEKNPLINYFKNKE